MSNHDLRTKHADILRVYDEHIEEFELFHMHVKNFFESRSLSHYVHSVRHRLKDINHFLKKIERKNAEDAQRDQADQEGPITPANVFKRITDIAGIRVLHLHISQFKHIHKALMDKVEDGEFTLFEEPNAYTWDPESGNFFESLGLTRKLKESYYTSIHYVLRPNSRSPATCEVQVRTLLEEVWGEVDHTMNYPTPTTDEHCREQIRVLARLVGAGTHLADSIMRRFASDA